MAATEIIRAKITSEEFKELDMVMPIDMDRRSRFFLTVGQAMYDPEYEKADKRERIEFTFKLDREEYHTFQRCVIGVNWGHNESYDLGWIPALIGREDDVVEIAGHRLYLIGDIEEDEGGISLVVDPDIDHHSPCVVRGRLDRERPSSIITAIFEDGRVFVSGENFGERMAVVETLGFQWEIIPESSLERVGNVDELDF